MRKLIWLLIFVVLGVSGCDKAIAGHATQQSELRDVTVTLQLTDADVADAGCETAGTGYDDVTVGAEVKIVNANNKVVGKGSWGAGQQDDDDFNTCDFVARGILIRDTFSPSYGVTFGNGHRGTIRNSHAELVADRWHFNLTLGDD